MKEKYSDLNKKVYYFTVLAVIAIMSMGLLVDNPLMDEFTAGFIAHLVLVFAFSICLLLYPIYMTHLFRTIIMMVASGYFYTIFFLYPDTWSNFIYLCFIPAIAILFFDSRLFCFSFIGNSIAIIIIFSFIMLTNQESFYPYIKQDIVGNIINFIGSQAVIYFIFYLTNARMKKQQLYYEQIKQSERLKTTGQLAAAVAHEIRNPLTVVKGFLQLYEKDTSNTNDTKRHYSLMIEELNTAEKVISQFLSVAKPNHDVQIETVDVREVLKSVADLLHSYGLLHDNQIELNIMEDLIIIANNMEFKQLLINIIKNAIEASNIGEPVVVEAKRKNSHVEIKVIDSGQGMTEKELESLGTPFYSLKSKGTGLGMMICYNIAAKYKGTIDFQSTVGKGTTVTILFPAKK